MKKLLLIILIFLIMGAASAHEDLNGTDESILHDMEYNYNIDDEDEILVVEQDTYIPVEVNVNESWSLNVYIDKYDSTVNEELVNLSYDQIDIPTSVLIDGEEVPLGLGKHKIVYEFKFTNTTSVYRPDVSVDDLGIYFDFEFVRNIKTPQNSIYRFNSQFNIIEAIEPIVTTFNLDDINITYSDSLFFKIKGISSGLVNTYLDETFFGSYEIDENPYEDEINTKKLAIGSYNLICIIESNNVYSECNISADNSHSMINVNFSRSKIVYTPNRYITIINTTLNVCDFPELNPIYIIAPPVDITYTRSIPVVFEGEGIGNLTVYIDGKKVYDSPFSLQWLNTCYIPTMDSGGNYFNEGTHNISFEMVFSDKYSSYNPIISQNNNMLIFDFSDSQDTNIFLNDKYIINTTVNINNKNTQFIPINSSAEVSIIHTNDINLKIDGLPYFYNLTVFIDNVEIFDGYTNYNTLNIETFFPRLSIEETNERDIQVGSHSIRFEFKALYNYDVDVSYNGNTLNFKFNQLDSNIQTTGVYYQFNTSLIIKEKQKTVHILKVKNNTYFDFTEFLVKMDLYHPEEDDDGDDDEEIPLGTQDVGIIVSNEKGVVYIDDDLINVYKSNQMNYDFDNEELPKPGKYTIKIINLADNTYDTVSFEVKKENRIFSKKYSSDDFNVLFTLDFSQCKDDLTGLCHVTLDGDEKVINIKNGLVNSKREVLFKDINPGTYTAVFTLKGNEIYNDVTLKSKVTVKKENPIITCNENGNMVELSIDISKSKTDAVLTVNAGGQEKVYTINKNTKNLIVEFDNLNSGSYRVEIYFKGNERYNSKTLTAIVNIIPSSKTPVTPPVENVEKKGNGIGNNSDGVGTGSGNSNATGNGNGTYNGKISFNTNGFNGDLGSQGSGHGDGVKSYEITKNIKKLDENSYLFWIILILAILLILGFIYKRRDNEEEY